MGEMKGIEYFWLKSLDDDDSNSNQLFLNKRVTPSEGDNLIDVTVSPNEFENTKCSLVYWVWEKVRGIFPARWH